MGRLTKESVLAGLDVVAFLEAELKNCRLVNNEEMKARCPFHHPDSNPSFYFNVHKLTYFCQSCQAKGDMFTFVQKKKSLDFHGALQYLGEFNQRAQQGLMPNSEIDMSRKGLSECPVDWSNPTAVYQYNDEGGNPSFYVLRWEREGFRKAVRQSRGQDTNGGWMLGRGDSKLYPYRLGTWEESSGFSNCDWVVIVEGENKVEELIKLTIPATCNPGGAGKWKDEFSQYFEGKQVYILPDNDEVGKEHAENVASSLRSVAGSIQVVELPGLAEKGDIIDWLDVRKGRDSSSILDELKGVLRVAPAWKPPQIPTGPLGKIKWEECSAEYYARDVPAPYAFLLGPTFEMSTLGVMVGPPGVGKGIFSIQLGLHIAAGIHFHGIWTTDSPKRVLYLSAEDSKATIHRRVHYAIQRISPEAQGLAHNNFHAASVTGNVHLCVSRGGSAVEITDNFSDLRQKVEENKPDLLILDTLSRFVGIDENNNQAMTAVCGMLEELIHEFGCSILFTHHTSKVVSGLQNNQRSLLTALSQTAVRGASALTGAARWMLNLAPLGQELAKKFLGEQAKEKSPGTYIAMEVSMSNNGMTGFRNYFERQEKGLLYPATTVKQEESATLDKEAYKLAMEVRRREHANERRLSKTRGWKAFGRTATQYIKILARAEKLEFVICVKKNKCDYLHSKVLPPPEFYSEDK